MTENANQNASLLQQQASDPYASVFVSASAGTGKTKILCDRFIRLMLLNVAPENILCLTFTNAAATEMHARIKSQLKKWSNSKDDDVVKDDFFNLTGKYPSIDDIANIKGLYECFKKVADKIKINTIHAFCLNLLQQFSFLDSTNIEIIDDIKKADLFSSAFQNVLESVDEFTVTAIDILTDHYDFQPIKKFIEEIIISNKLKFENYNEKFSSPNDLKHKIYAVHGGNTEIRAHHLEKNYLQEASQRLKILAKILADENEPLGLKIAAALDNSDAMALSDILLNEDGVLKKNILRKELREKFDGFYSALEIEAENIKHFNEKYRSQICADLNFAISWLSQKVYGQFEILKKQNGLVEYDDLIKKTITLLNQSEYSQWILFNVDQRIDHILIDEAQDLSPLQWKLIQLISNEFFVGISAKENLRTIFIVGDYKQSIYSFQGAEPIIFNKIRQYYAAKLKSVEMQWNDVQMNTSFRTTAPVLSLVDRIFNEPAINNAVSASSNKISHIAHRMGGGNCVAWDLEEKNPVINKESGWQLPQMEPKANNPKFKLAAQISNHISNWITNGRLLHGHKRLIEPKDIMILVRKRSEFTKILAAELKRKSIAVIDQNLYSYEDELIFQDLVALANFVINPFDDFNLACLLKSPMIGISEDDLFKICFKREASLWESLEMLPQIHDYLAMILENYKTQTTLEFFFHILEFDCKAEEFIKRFGKRASLVIDNFYLLIQKYKSSNIDSLYGFVTWLQNPSIKVKNPTSSDNAVKIMTVHSAKGLQSPIVILADASSSEHSPLQQIFWVDRNYSNDSIDSDYWMTFSSYKKFDDQFNKRVKESNKDRYADENFRLLYVALTRAEDEIYVAGWENNKANSSWYNAIKKQLTDFAPPIEEFSAELTRENVVELCLPDFVTEVAKNDSAPKIKQATSSSVEKTAAMIEGEIIHQLLQYIPKIDSANLMQMIVGLTHKHRTMLSEGNVQSLVEIAVNIVKKFPDVFALSTLSELPVAGLIDGVLLSTRLDKVVITENEVKIIDFKTDHNLGGDKSKYAKQLSIYKRLLQPLYLEHEITCHVLWVRHGVLEELDII